MIKQHYGDEKQARLVHSHPFVPPQIYASKASWGKLAGELGEAELNTRIEKELDNGNLLTIGGRTFNFGLRAHPLVQLSQEQQRTIAGCVFESSIELARAEVIVNERLMMANTDNIFAVGDVINLAIIKT